MVLRRETSACHGTTARLMQPAALSLTATLSPRTRNRWPWPRAKVGYLCLLPLTQSLAVQGASHQGHLCCSDTRAICVALTLQALTLFHAVNTVDNACQKRGVILRWLCKSCNTNIGSCTFLSCLICAGNFTFMLCLLSALQARIRFAM